MKRPPSTTDRVLRALVVAVGLLLALPAVAQSNALAIMYFDSAGNPELAPLKVGLAQMLITDLSTVEEVRLIEREQLQRVLNELELGHSGLADPVTAAKAGKMLGAEWMLMGRYFEFQGYFRVEAQLVHVETTQILYSHGMGGTVDGFMEIEKEIARFYREKLVIEATRQAPTRGEGDAPPVQDEVRAPAAEPAPIVAAAAEPPSILRPQASAIEAAVAFSEGLIYLDKKDVSRARESFEQAVAKNPDLAHAKAQLAALEL